MMKNCKLKFSKYKLNISRSNVFGEFFLIEKRIREILFTVKLIQVIQEGPALFQCFINSNVCPSILSHFGSRKKLGNLL